ncbi:hypothetical protein UFOVP938_17 [uncultured Caudovirales phage]|uniref:Peptidase S74 domain-containing protein n=1 Tax=uncultured Caudovirales phage TaxID=2100421 RepID=A0A6J5QPZ8_9CAUD|nr:hypothetical protein UFOVP596_27 [uncultured Caudovirales phage]CAB4172539.1 hypothetical protein UFOVP938_17 [uncultured Caudovirales phage]CAB4183561.1 hypothetical protein UFOVP1104_23 [uncultured Caudovirales phage]CAB4202759.1 hypothetical protein UFOVP1371_36 [uncultured Caudovirales phage]CAB4214805.1 hypothetical protein UFOVP1468_44 [uncultured Caudovirales phage]
MTVPNTFANATTAIPLVQLDQNFNTGVTLGNTTVFLGNTTTTLGNVTLTGANVTTKTLVLNGATSGSTTITPTDAVTATITLPSATGTLQTTAGSLASNTGLPISTGVSGLGSGVATFLATPSSANLAAAVTGETGSGALVFGTSPTISAITFSGVNTGDLNINAGSVPNTGNTGALSATQSVNGAVLAGFYHSASVPEYIYVLHAATNNGTGNQFMRFDEGGGSALMRMAFDSNGGLRNYSGNNVNLSDMRVKDLFEDYTPEMLNELEAKFCAIRRGRFKYNDQTHDDWNYGKSAQSVAEHLPGLAGVWNETKEKDGVLEEVPKEEQLLCEYSHDITQIGEALLVRALKRIEALEARVAALEAK